MKRKVGRFILLMKYNQHGGVMMRAVFLNVQQNPLHLRGISSLRELSAPVDDYIVDEIYRLLLMPGPLLLYRRQRVLHGCNRCLPAFTRSFHECYSDIALFVHFSCLDSSLYILLSAFHNFLFIISAIPEHFVTEKRESSKRNRLL